MPDAINDYEPLLPIATKIAEDNTQKSYVHALSRTLVLYRLGRHRGALQAIHDSEQSKWYLKTERDVLQFLCSAMCHYQLSKKKEAKEMLAKATRMMDSAMPALDEPLGIGNPGLTYIQCQIIHREAEALILGRHKAPINK